MADPLAQTRSLHDPLDCPCQRCGPWHTVQMFPERDGDGSTVLDVDFVFSPAAPASLAPASVEVVDGVSRLRPRSGRGAGSRSRDDQGDEVVAGVHISHPERVVYPDAGITKARIARYYAAVATHILPHLRSRPTVLVRCPEGLAGECFYQKHAAAWAPATLRRVAIREKAKTGEYLVVEDVLGLVGLIQMGVLELHTWNAQADRLERPDRLVFDLDPAPDVPWTAVRVAARLVRSNLEERGLQSFVKTTGGKGLHVVAPVRPGPSWSACVEFARNVTEALVAETPNAFVATMTKSARKGRIFIDYFRNQRGATSVAAYSTRARPGAPVSVPLTWDELEAVPAGDHFTLDAVERRLARLKRDSWAGYQRVEQSLPPLGGRVR